MSVLSSVKIALMKSFLKMTAVFCALCLLSPFCLFSVVYGVKENGVSLVNNDGAFPSVKIFRSEDGSFYCLDAEKGTASLIFGAEGVKVAEIPERLICDGDQYTVVSVSRGAFAENIEISEIILPTSVTRIDDEAFFGCISLEKVTAEGLTSAGTDVFCATPFIKNSEFVSLGSVLLRYNGEEKTVIVPKGVTFVADAFAWNTAVKTVILPEGIVEVGDGAFACADNLKTVSLPFSLEKIGNKAFFACVSLEEVSVAANVIYIGESAFSGTPFLASLLECEGDMLILGGGVLLRYKGTETVVAVPDGVVGISDAFAYSGVSVVEIPDGCSIGEGAFQGASALSRVTVCGDCGGISQFAFEGCKNLTIINFEGDFTGTVGKFSFKGTTDKLSVYFRNGKSGFEAFGVAGIDAVSPGKLRYS